MDPNEARNKMMELVSEIHAAVSQLPPEDTTYLEDTANELAYQVEALDEWLRKGGFLPKAWEKGEGS